MMPQFAVKWEVKIYGLGKPAILVYVYMFSTRSLGVLHFDYPNVLGLSVETISPSLAMTTLAGMDQPEVPIKLWFGC